MSKTITLVIVVSSLFSCSKKKIQDTQDRSYIFKTLQDFISQKEGSNLSRKDIEPLLFDIQDEQATRGRAIHIGDQLFLTAYHVLVDENMQLVHQSLRGELPRDEGRFTILHKDINADLALLRMAIENPRGKALYKLRYEKLKQGDLLSQYIFLTGPKKNDEFILPYDGVDYYDNVKPALNLGRFVFRKGSLLFEKQGSVWPFDEDFFIALGMNKGRAKINKTTQVFTSIPVFPGESGSGVFCRRDYEGLQDLSLCGITVIAWAAGFEIQTPEHPLGYETVQQSSNFIVRPEIIAEFIQEYLKKETALK